MRIRTEKRRGAIVVIVAVSLTILLGVAAIVLDGGLLLDDAGRIQAAADAAALAAADDMFSNWSANSGTDPSGTARTSALSTASANGFSNDGTTSVVTVNIPPTSGNFANKAGYAEVIIQYNQTRGLSKIFGSGNLSVKGRAVAYGNPGNIGILILNKHIQGALEIRGNVNVQNGGQLWSNSDNTSANDSASLGASGSVYLGSGATLTAGGINVFNSLVADGTVVYQNADGTTNASGRSSTYTTLQTDPLSSITEPTTTGLTSRGSVTVTSTTTLQPGAYDDITIGSTGGWVWNWRTGYTWSAGTSPTVTMAAGIYYINRNGSITLTAGSLQGAGVMIVNNSQNDSVFGWSNPAQGTINLSPPTVNADGTNSGGTWPTGTTAATYAGISMWVPRSWSDEVHFQSNSNATVSGTWYAAGAEYDIRANGSSVVFNIGNYICDLGEWNQKVGGDANTGTGTVNINPGTAAATQRPTLVE